MKSTEGSLAELIRERLETVAKPGFEIRQFGIEESVDWTGDDAVFVWIVVPPDSLDDQLQTAVDYQWELTKALLELPALEGQSVFVRYTNQWPRLGHDD